MARGGEMIPPFYTEQQLLDYRKAVIEECKKLILDDAYAITFQSFGQYRIALAKELEKMK
jgi:hypothetical protein